MEPEKPMNAVAVVDAEAAPSPLPAATDRRLADLCDPNTMRYIRIAGAAGGLQGFQEALRLADEELTDLRRQYEAEKPTLSSPNHPDHRYWLTKISDSEQRRGLAWYRVEHYGVYVEEAQEYLPAYRQACKQMPKPALAKLLVLLNVTVRNPSSGADWEAKTQAYVHFLSQFPGDAVEAAIRSHIGRGSGFFPAVSDLVGPIEEAVKTRIATLHLLERFCDPAWTAPPSLLPPAPPEPRDRLGSDEHEISID